MVTSGSLGKLSANQVRYTKHDNVFLWIEDMAKAQTFADRFVNLNWPTILELAAILVGTSNPPH